MLAHKKVSKFTLLSNIWKVPGFLSFYGFTRRILGDNYYFWFLLRIQNWRERYEIEVFNKIVKTGMVVLDVGANIGSYTVVAAKACGEKGKVYAFEPAPANLNILKKNLKRNLTKKLQGVVEIVPLAVTSQKSQRTLYLDSLDPGSTSIFKKNIIVGDKVAKVETTSLDEYFKTKKQKIDLIKIDTQGSEEMIIKGARNVIKRDKPIIFMEFWPIGLRRAGYEPERLLAEVVKLGYEIENVNTSSRKVERLSKRKITSMCSINSKEAGYTNFILRMKNQTKP